VQTNSPEWRSCMNTPRSPVITLFRSHLVAADACAEGLALYDAFAALQGRTKSLRLTWAHLLWAACDARSRGFVGWAQEMGLLPRFNLRGADLRDANLYGANLRSANLRSADLGGADLGGANLYGANLGGCSRWSHDAAVPGWTLTAGVLVPT